MSNTKTFFDNEVTFALDDKSFILTSKSGAGNDYKASYETLKTLLKGDILKPFLKSMIGKLHTNTSNKTRDSKKLNDEYFEYLLLDGRELLVGDYPDLVNFLGATNTQETFRLPDFRDGTLRNIKSGSGRALGSYEEDAMQRISGGFESILTSSNVDNSWGVCRKEGIRNHGISGNGTANLSNVRIDNSLMARTAEETRMKNVGVQFYIIAKVLI